MIRLDPIDLLSTSVHSIVVRLFFWFASLGLALFLGSSGSILLGVFAIGSAVVLLWGIPALYALFGCLYRLATTEFFTVGWVGVTFLSGIAVSSVLWKEGSFTFVSLGLSLGSAIAYRAMCRLAERYGA